MTIQTQLRRGCCERKSRKITPEAVKNSQRSDANTILEGHGDDANMSALKSNAAVLFTLVVVRLQSALWMIISDCDETYNYWEPLHYLLKGRGFQTWEYSPQFALRSYTYLWLHGLPAKLLMLVVDNGVVIFYFVRCLLAITCALLEYRLYKVMKRKCGGGVSKIWLFLQLVNAGMYISSSALLPSSFAMYATLIMLGAWLSDDTRTAIAVTALCGLIGWPFAVIVSVPFVLELLFKKKQMVHFIKNSLFFGAMFGIPIVVIDSAYFGTFTLAAWNIIRYNVFSSHGPDLYGVEPVLFYLKNMLINHHVSQMLVVGFPVIQFMAKCVGARNAKNRLSPMRSVWIMTPLYLWLAVFLFQPHKEERFIFPVYPFFALGTALFLDQLLNNMRTYLGPVKSALPNRVMALTVFGIALLTGVARMVALSTFYRAPFAVIQDLPQADGEMNICYGKEWYRFPGHFFLPDNYRARFIQSSFNGMLPAYFQETDNGTQIVHKYFNDQNKGDSHMLFDLNRCDFLVDLDTGYFYDELSQEPNYAADRKTWSVVKSADFILSAQSDMIARAFYVPYWSYRNVVFGKYFLLQRIKLN